MTVATLPTPRQIDASRRELYGRRIGRAGVGPCPGCGELVVVVRYVPKSRYTGDDPADVPRARRQPARRRRRDGGYLPSVGDAPLMVFEFRTEARANTFANYATTSSWLTARLLDDETPPLEDREIRACLHIARHPECTAFLTRPKA